MSKKLPKTLLTLVLALALVFTGFMIPTTKAQAATQNIPIYRLYNPTNGEHLYTTDENEKNVLFSQHGWGYEGIGWYAPSSGTPVYRLYNPILANHLYTTDTNEVSVLTREQGWVQDNNGNPVFYSGGSVPIYRVYNAGLRGMHHLTTDSNEYSILPQYGWQQEGIAVYAKKNGAPIQTQYCVPSIDTVASTAAIEADVTMNGSGSGCHAKLVICTASAAVSFGLQYDVGAAVPYGGKTMVMIENIGSNNAGGQQYDRPQNREVALGQTCHLMLTYNSDGTGSVYLNNELIGGYSNSNMANQQVYLRVEGSARQNGDVVDCNFSNIKLKNDGVYDPNRGWGTYEFKQNPTINSTVHAWNNITISGYVSGLGAGEDWDNRYNDVSDIIQFN